jgi:predicted GH43/DUF377 family glycosyl hydrolase
MHWHKQGRIFEPQGLFGWMNTHAQIPTVLVMEDRLRVYFATRPRSDLTLTTFVDLDKKDPKRVLYVHDRPILELGRRGTFDNHGIMPNYVTVIDGKVYLYYVGWYRGSSIPYHNAIGLAISEDGGTTFSKLFESPILDRTSLEPYSMGSIYIVPENERYHMYYTYVFDWLEINGKLEPIYHIRHATSKDGVEWTKTNQVIIGEKHDKEAVARPSVIRFNDRYHMWFCFRGSMDFRGGKDSYRIGYAWSNDLLHWNREDGLAGIDVSDSGWDSEMITYPCIVPVDGQHLMFYNGNGFGTSGFGYAVAAWEDENGARR